MSEDMTESGPSIPPGLHTTSHRDSAESVLPVAHYLYLCIKAEGDYPLLPTLFNCDMILGMCISREVSVHSDTEVILEYGESANPELIIT